MKKLLYILIFAPFVLFGQSDKLILSSGDTLIVNIVEVGVKEVKYTHLGEDLNYSIKRNKIIKIIHDSGRVDIINTRLSDKLDSPDEEYWFNSSELPFSRSFEVGLLYGFSNSSMIGLEDFRSTNASHISFSSVRRPLGGLFLQYNFTNELSVTSKLLYHQKGEQVTYDIEVTPENLPEGTGEIINISQKIMLDYYTLPILIQYHFTHKDWSMFFNSGVYLGYLNKAQVVDNVITYEQTSNSGAGQDFPMSYDMRHDDITENYKTFDFGITVGLGLSYRLSDVLKFQLESSIDNGLVEVRKLTITEEQNHAPNNFFDKFRTFSMPITFGLSYKIK